MRRREHQIKWWHEAPPLLQHLLSSDGVRRHGHHKAAMQIGAVSKKSQFPPCRIDVPDSGTLGSVLRSDPLAPREQPQLAGA